MARKRKKGTDKEEFVEFIKNQININLSNDKKDRLNQKKNYLYTEIPSDKKTMIMSYFNRLGITPEKHIGDNYWIPLNKNLINKAIKTNDSKYDFENKDKPSATEALKTFTIVDNNNPERTVKVQAKDLNEAKSKGASELKTTNIRTYESSNKVEALKEELGKKRGRIKKEKYGLDRS